MATARKEIPNCESCKRRVLMRKLFCRTNEGKVR